MSENTLTTDNPLVSIITPSYNQAAFLEQTLRSVLEQDYAPLEYLVVDGASSDGSPEIIRTYARRYPDRLTWWVSEPDRGQAEAINKGFQRARGEIVAWLNSDDLYLPGAIRRSVSALYAPDGAGQIESIPTLDSFMDAYPPSLKGGGQGAGPGMVFGDAISIDLDGRPFNRLSFGNWGLAEFIRFRIICQPAVFIHRKVLEQTGFLDPAYHYMLDHHLWLRLARLAPVVRLGGPPLAAARYHPAAKNIAQAPGFGRETLRLLEWMQTQPGLAEMIAQNRHQSLGGAYRLNARYLLDGGLPGPAIKSYLKALAAWPTFTLKHSHRMLYTLLALLHLNRPLDRARERRAPTARCQMAASLRQTFGDQLENWPGITLDPP